MTNRKLMRGDSAFSGETKYSADFGSAGGETDSMTPRQRALLFELCEELGELYDPTMKEDEAEGRIRELQAKRARRI